MVFPLLFFTVTVVVSALFPLYATVLYFLAIDTLLALYIVVVCFLLHLLHFLTMLPLLFTVAGFIFTSSE